MTQEITTGLLLDNDACYAAMQAHDPRFDGRFFCGVSSTGIYCRPVCRAKVPKKKNCSFFMSAAAAEAAGYRPCLRCRPELAPGLAPVDSATRLARSAALRMEEDILDSRTISELASILGITDRHLRRVFFTEYGVSPVQYLQTQRLLLAKSLLTDTQLSVTEVAMSAGFGSIRRFNDLFKTHYRLAPKMFRNKPLTISENDQGITLSLGYRPPYAWNNIVTFLAVRAIPGVEHVSDGIYRRTVAIRKGKTIHYGWITVANQPKQSRLSVKISPALLPVVSSVLSRIRLLFDVNCNPEIVYEKLSTMKRLAPNIYVPGIRVPGSFDSFEMSVRAILGQQISVKAAITLAGRVASVFGEKIDTPFDNLSFTFPEPEKLCAPKSPIENQLRSLGISEPKSRSIMTLAKAMTSNSIVLSYGANPIDEMKKLSNLPGFGPWTIQYIAMRALGWPDAFPHTDFGVRKALSNRTPQEILKMSQQWSPWRSYATILLWNSLSNNTKIKKRRYVP